MFAGIHCDVTVGNTNAVIHSTVLSYLTNIDSRFSPLVRLVKLWARAQGINDSSRGTFSSYALTLMVVFLLQRQQPPILPPLHQLFQQQPTKAETAFLHAGQQPRKTGLQACQQVAHQELKNMGAANKSSLAELLLSFFVMYAAACEEWLCASNVGFRWAIPVLVQAGYRVIAPDLKGFGQSDKPQDASLYIMPNLLKDVVGILDQLDVQKVHCVVGHDWGAAVAWQLAGRFPKRFERLVALSVGHNASMFSMGGNRQREKSWYMLFFKFRGVSEKALQRNNWALMRQLWFTDEPQVAETYIADLSKPGALTAVVPIMHYKAWAYSVQNYYPKHFQTDVLGYVEDGKWQYHQIHDAGHWIPRDAPNELNDLLINFLKSTAFSKL
ncbi:MAG: alpha beta hydrolase [Trebouxia sp. A1-2]|nr:MAG: alpha beta hydrolase [Trebouxia sp. A1-2]